MYISGRYHPPLRRDLPFRRKLFGTLTNQKKSPGKYLFPGNFFDFERMNNFTAGKRRFEERRNPG